MNTQHKLTVEDANFLLNADGVKNCYPFGSYTDCDWPDPCVICGCETWERVQGDKYYLPIGAGCLKVFKQVAKERGHDVQG